MYASKLQALQVCIELSAKGHSLLVQKFNACVHGIILCAFQTHWNLLSNKGKSVMTFLAKLHNVLMPVFNWKWRSADRVYCSFTCVTW